MSGAVTNIGSGSSNVQDLRFGPDGALYVAEFGSDLVWRVAPTIERPWLTLSRVGTMVQLSWPSVLNQTYQLRSTTDLSAVAWQSEGVPIPGTGGLLVTNLPLGADSERGPAVFYRVSRQ